MRPAFPLALALAALPARADLAQVGSFSFRETVPCESRDHNTVLVEPGAGRYPATPFWIVGVSVFIKSDDPGAMAVVGVLGGPGDLISPFQVGQGSATWNYPAGAGYRVLDGYELHLHTECQTGYHGVAGVTILYRIEG